MQHFSYKLDTLLRQIQKNLGFHQGFSLLSHQSDELFIQITGNHRHVIHRPNVHMHNVT